ncbi:MAG: substrate-binding domain-containing protein, partial [Clostridiales bacterium]|nr:substrate-binding domain-containing protein [Clostridiales bacterium]
DYEDEKTLALLMAILMTACLAGGCGATPSASHDTQEQANTEAAGETADKKVKVGASLCTNQEPIWVAHEKALKDYCDELGFEFVSQMANNDSEKQITQISSLLMQDIDILVVALVDPATAASVLQEARDEGVVVVGLDHFSNACPFDFGITFDNKGVGALMAQYAKERFPTGNYVWLGGDVAAVEAAQDFEDGAIEEIQDLIDKGDINLVMRQNCKDWAPSEGMAHAENALTANDNKIDVFLCANDGIASGAIQAVESVGLTGKAIVTGQDAELAALQRIVAGTQIMTVYKSSVALCKAAIDNALILHNGGALEDAVEYYGVPAKMLIPIAIDKDNIDQYFIDTGVYTHEEIYGQ